MNFFIYLYLIFKTVSGIPKWTTRGRSTVWEYWHFSKLNASGQDTKTLWGTKKPHEITCVYNMLMYNVCVCVFNYTDPQMCRGQQGIDRWGRCLAGGRTSSRTVNVRSRRRRRSLWTADTNTETHSGQQIIFIQSVQNYMANIYHLSRDDKEGERTKRNITLNNTHM